MDLFTVINDAHAILRLPKGIFKQVKLYRRGDRIYAPHGGGFIELRGRPIGPDREVITTHPDITVIDMEVPLAIYTERNLGVACFRIAKQ